MEHIHDSVGSHVPFSWAEFIFFQLSELKIKCFMINFSSIYGCYHLRETLKTERISLLWFHISILSRTGFQPYQKWLPFTSTDPREIEKQCILYTFVQSSFNILLYCRWIHFWCIRLECSIKSDYKFELQHL